MIQMRGQRGAGEGCAMIVVIALICLAVLGYLYVSQNPDEGGCRDTVSGQTVCD